MPKKVIFQGETSSDIWASTALAEGVTLEQGGDRAHRMSASLLAGHDGRDSVLWSNRQITEYAHEDISQRLRGLSLPMEKPFSACTSNFLVQIQIFTLQPTLF